MENSDMDSKIFQEGDIPGYLHLRNVKLATLWTSNICEFCRPRQYIHTHNQWG